MREFTKQPEKVGADREFEEILSLVSAHYVTLERAIRAIIDKVVGPVCRRCQRVCCQPGYCRNTLLNPWYRYLFEHFEPGVTLPWQRRQPPPGLGPTGCLIRAGRYAYCYAYNCRVIRSSFRTDTGYALFQEISDILKNLGLNFAGRRHLTDVRSWDEITGPRLERLDKKIEEGTERFHELRSLLCMVKPGI